MAGLWLIDEVVNHVGRYGSKVAEGCSAFQRRSCYSLTGVLCEAGAIVVVIPYDMEGGPNRGQAFKDDRNCEAQARGIPSRNITFHAIPKGGSKSLLEMYKIVGFRQNTKKYHFIIVAWQYHNGYEINEDHEKNYISGQSSLQNV